MIVCLIAMFEFLIRCNRTEGVSVRWCYGIRWQWSCDALMVSAISTGQVRAMMILDRCASKDNSDKCESCGQVWVRDRRAGVGPTDRCGFDDSKLAAGRCIIYPGCSRMGEHKGLAKAIRMLIARVVLFGRSFTFRHLSVGYPEDDIIRSRLFRICFLLTSCVCRRVVWAQCDRPVSWLPWQGIVWVMYSYVWHI